jgi:hypothetical protein
MLEFVREVQELMEVEARTAVASGWAELRLDEGEIGTSIHLEPVKLASAPLEVYFDSVELVVCSVGRNGMSCEFFSQDTGEIKGQVRALAAAVVAGNYVERLSKGTSELLAEWPGPEGQEEAKREALVASGGGGTGYRTVTYEPY